MSEHRGGSLKQGVWRAQPPRSYRVIPFYIALKSCQNARFKAYSYLFRKYKKLSSPYMERGCGGCNLLQGSYRLSYLIKC